MLIYFPTTPPPIQINSPKIPQPIQKNIDCRPAPPYVFCWNSPYIFFCLNIQHLLKKIIHLPSFMYIYFPLWKLLHYWELLDNETKFSSTCALHLATNRESPQNLSHRIKESLVCFGCSVLFWLDSTRVHTERKLPKPLAVLVGLPTLVSISRTGGSSCWSNTCWIWLVLPAVMLEMVQAASFWMFILWCLSRLWKAGRAPWSRMHCVWLSSPVTMFPIALKAGVITDTSLLFKSSTSLVTTSEKKIH